MKKNILLLFFVLLCCIGCTTRYLRIGETKGRWPPCEDARIIHKIGRYNEGFIKNYMKISLCDSLCDREHLFDMFDISDIAPSVYDLKKVLGEPLHIYTNKKGYKAFFYPSFGRQNKQGVCEIDELFVIFYLQNDSLCIDYDARFYSYDSQDCDGDPRPFLKYWNNPNLSKESKFGDKFAPVDFTYDKRDGGTNFISLEDKIYPNSVEKKE